MAKVYLGSTQPHWPNFTLDQEQERKDIEGQLTELAKKASAVVTFAEGELLRTPEEAKPWLSRIGEADGILIIPISQAAAPLNALMENDPASAIVFSRPYASHSWAWIPEIRKRSVNRIDVVASSSTGDLEPAARLFKAVHHLKASKVLVAVETAASRQAQVEAFQKAFGAGFEFIGGKP